MSAEKESLYGKSRPKKSSNEQTASNLMFTSQLSSLIAQGTSTGSSQGRQRPSKNPKSDIFAKHNKGSQKRAAADLLDDDRALKQIHRSTQDIGSVDTATLGRSRRRMEEKVRMYDDMKKGLYLAGDSDDDDTPIDLFDPDAYLKRLRRKEKEGLVDFDLKHSEHQAAKEDDNDDDNTSIVSYEDEFGRSRHGTRAEAAEASRAKDEETGSKPGQERWRPARPDNLIYGEAVQTEAFNPDGDMASQMSHIAARRDRSPTPPELKHYDAEEEVRNRGTGFYSFSTDEEERKKQMEQLKLMREQTMLKRTTAEERIAKRKANEKWRLKEIKRLREESAARRDAADQEKKLNPPPPLGPRDIPNPELHFLPECMQRPSWVPRCERNPRRLFPNIPWTKQSKEPELPSL